jgi:hypothetical protein
VIATLTEIGIVLGSGLSILCFRYSQWHSREADYWRQAHFHPDQTWQYAVLVWVRSHPPGWLEMARGWRPPPARRQRSMTSRRRTAVHHS